MTIKRKSYLIYDILEIKNTSQLKPNFNFLKIATCDTLGSVMASQEIEEKYSNQLCVSSNVLLILSHL